MTKKRRIAGWLVIVAVLVGGFMLWRHRFGVPEDFSDPAAEYKYGSIGSDHPLAQAPIPYWIWKVLPELFPPSEFIPKEAGPWNGKPGFEAFGLVTEANMEHPRGYVEGQIVYDRPIGFSKRTVFGIDFVGVNCAFCHLTTVRPSPQEKAQVVLGGTGNTLNIEQYFLYMFAAMGDKKRFNADDVMAAVAKEARKQNKELGLVERLVYRYVAIPWVIPAMLEDRQKKYFDFITIGNTNRLANFGPGRVDTWALYKRMYADPPEHQRTNGIVDFPSIWNQRARVGMQMHWDGNIDVAEERNIVSALSVIGKRLNYLDFPRLMRTVEFTNGLLPPRYIDRLPDSQPPVQQAKVEAGRELFREHCASCHAADGDRIGRVEPIEDLGTDTERLKDFTRGLADGLNTLGTDEWKLRNFKPQHGYVNSLLDGIWLRAPYLHNGSVPTLRDLLNPAEAPPDKPDAPIRPKVFCRGTDLYDWKNLGFLSTPVNDTGDDSCGTFFVYRTSVSGNGNGGHLYGTGLSDDEKDKLVEFMKTL
jgi:cytochrome c553